MEAQANHSVKTQVVIVDDHTMLNELITDVVDSMKDFQVAGSARNETEALQLCTEEQPDLVVLDLVLASTYGLSLLGKISRLCPRTRVVIFSGNLTPEIIQQVLAAGTYSLISKSATLGDFRAALLTVAAGRTCYSPDVAGAIKGLVVNPTPLRRGQSKLTRREETVLCHLAQGLSSKGIAVALGVSIHTVANHRSRVMKKTGLRRAAQLSLDAMRRGMLGDAGLPPRLRT